MIKRTLLSTFLLLAFASTTWAVDLTGDYTIHGTSPGRDASYQGQVKVIQQGDVYVVAWRIGEERYIGTGLLLDDSFAVVYEGQGAPAGLVLYKILPSGELTGVYTNLGQTEVGTETWKPASQ